LVFWKKDMIFSDASPAIYINAMGTHLRKYLLAQFDEHFQNTTKYKTFRRKHTNAADVIIQYYSFINIISEDYDFSWEREWRYHGDLKFEFEDVVAIICSDPPKFRETLYQNFKGNQLLSISKIPLLNPDWNYEEFIEAMSHQIWDLD